MTDMKAEYKQKSKTDSQYAIAYALLVLAETNQKNSDRLVSAIQEGPIRNRPDNG